MHDLIDRWLAVGALPSDGAEQRALKRVLVGAVYAFLFFGLTWVLTGFSPFRPGTLIVAACFFAGTLLNLAIFARTRRFERFLWSTFVIGLTVSLAGQIVIGGFAASGGAIFWGVIAPIGAVIFFGPERAFRWFLAYLAVVVILVAVDPWVRNWATTPYPLSITFFAVDTIGPAAIGFLTVRYVDRRRRAAQARSDELLLNVLPEPIAERLKAGAGVIADQHPAVSVLFADVVDFTPFAEATPPASVVDLLNDLFSEFDELADRFGMEKIKTIGDAYMAVAGVPEPIADHAACALRMGIEMLAGVRLHRDRTGRLLDLRVGIASGPVVAGVIGRRKFSYDLWGDTVNTASRMESSGIPGCIQVTPETRELLGEGYPWRRRDEVPIKGKGTMTTFVLDPTALGADAAPRPAGRAGG